MKPISGKQFAKSLQKHGWNLSRINGSHHIFTKEGEITRISLPIHGNKDLKLGLLKHLMNISKIDESEL